MYKTVEEYAEHVRRRMVDALSHVTFDRKDRALEAIGEVLGEAARIVQQSQMTEEVAAQNYDLATLTPGGAKE